MLEKPPGWMPHGSHVTMTQITNALVHSHLLVASNIWFHTAPSKPEKKNKTSPSPECLMFYRMLWIFRSSRLVENGWSRWQVLDSQHSKRPEIRSQQELFRPLKIGNLGLMSPLLGDLGLGKEVLLWLVCCLLCFSCAYLWCVGVLLCVLFRNFWGVHCIVNEAGCLYVEMTET